MSTAEKKRIQREIDGEETQAPSLPAISPHLKKRDQSERHNQYASKMTTFNTDISQSKTTDFTAANSISRNQKRITQGKLS